MSSELRASIALTASLIALASAFGGSTAVAQTEPPAVAAAEPTEPQDTDGEAEPSEYDTVIADALREFGAGQYDAAADDFRRALALRPSARVLRGLGTALFELGDHVAAIEVLERALSHPVDPLNETLRQEVLHLLRRAERHVAEIVISVNATDAEIFLAGRAVQPGVIRTNGGRQVLEARARGHLPWERTLEAVPGERLRVAIELEPLAGPSVTVVTPRRSRSLALGLPSVVVGGAGVALGALWLTHHNDELRQCPSTVGGVGCRNRDQLERRRRSSIGVIGIGSALLLAGVVLTVIGLMSDDDDETTAWGCAPDRGLRCSVRGHF